MKTTMAGTLFGALALWLVLSAPAHADTELEGTFRLGYLATSGNTDSDNLNARLRLDVERERWRYRTTLAAVGAREEGTTTAEDYEADGRVSYEVTEQDFGFLRVDWRKDRFSGYRRQFSQTAGYGRRLFDTATHRLDLELGAGARQARLADGTSENEPILRAATDYRYFLNDNTRLEFEVGVESGSDNTFSEAIAGVNARLFENVGLVVSYTLRHNSSVPLGNVRTDTRTALSVEYRF